MAYSSVRGRKPIERASKISHTNVISNPAVQALLSECTVPRPAEPAVLSELLTDAVEVNNNAIRAVVAVDGSMREIAVREDFPAAGVTFFAFGPLLFELEDLRDLDDEPFIAPEDLERLKNIQRYSLALPTRNISRNSRSLTDSVRYTLHEFFSAHHNDDDPLYKSLRWLLFCGWAPDLAEQWTLPTCPNYGCDAQDIVLRGDTPDQSACPRCSGPIYIIDAARLHERVDEDQGASGISSYVLTLCEQTVMLHVIRQVWELKPALLKEILFIKDGPLAFFGMIAPLSARFRELTHFLRRRGGLNVVGLEKSGSFVEHAVQIDEHLPRGTVLPLANNYIYRYIIPGDPNGTDPYGFNTYWGGKLIFKASDGNVYVASIPTNDGFNPSPTCTDFMNLDEILAVVAELKCSMYDNALIPVALANRLVSLSEVPSQRILENFARALVG